MEFPSSLINASVLLDIVDTLRTQFGISQPLTDPDIVPFPAPSAHRWVMVILNETEVPVLFPYGTTAMALTDRQRVVLFKQYQLFHYLKVLNTINARRHFLGRHPVIGWKTLLKGQGQSDYDIERLWDSANYPLVFTPDTWISYSTPDQPFWFEPFFSNT